ncbi:MAG TPA: DNA starvation/stationary phase protection protein [Bacteroidia bacterium]|jgi:starvation-inducible DNA-binding protein|nr:DNA starvation/stationary phase protection protein [Bacteroidia bacterium]
MKPKIGIPEKKLDKVAEQLSVVLANEMVLYVKTRKFHWNVSGESFMELHKLFESQYTKLERSIDEIAERINKLGSPAIGTMQEFLKVTTLKEHPHKYPSSKDMLGELLDDHESIIILLRKEIKTCSEKHEDAGTADFMTGLMELHETNAWILRRYLK